MTNIWCTTIHIGGDVLDKHLMHSGVIKTISRSFDPGLSSTCFLWRSLLHNIFPSVCHFVLRYLRNSDSLPQTYRSCACYINRAWPSDFNAMRMERKWEQHHAHLFEAATPHASGSARASPCGSRGDRAGCRIGDGTVCRERWRCWSPTPGKHRIYDTLVLYEIDL